MKKLIIISIFSLIFSLNTYSQRLYEKEALEVGIESIDNFREFLSLKNDANNIDDIDKLIKWTSVKFNKLGFKLKRLETESIPLLLAESNFNKNYKTILIYMHLDGQPVDRNKWFQDDPYLPVLKKPNPKGEYEIVDWNNIKNKTL